MHDFMAGYFEYFSHLVCCCGKKLRFRELVQNAFLGSVQRHQTPGITAKCQHSLASPRQYSRGKYMLSCCHRHLKQVPIFRRGLALNCSATWSGCRMSVAAFGLSMTSTDHRKHRAIIPKYPDHNRKQKSVSSFTLSTKFHNMDSSLLTEADGQLVSKSYR
jgi:hypothetical protein